jgi:hemolysin-activating ACP:hemolysin acyltransferase
VLPYTLPFIIIGQWGLYRSWNGAPTMMMAWAYFTFGNTAIRILSSYLMVRETFDWRVPVGCAVMIAGSMLIKTGMK